MKLRDGLILSIVIVLAAAAGWVWLAGGGLKPAPDVTFRTLDGRTVALAELRGNPVVITFWATTCPSCIREMPHLVELYEDMNADGLEIIGVAMHYDPPNRVKELVERRELPYTIVLDTDEELAKAFGNVRLTPTTFVINANGRIVHQRIGELDTARVRAMVEDRI